jgi:hypothetical protein
VRFAEPRQEAGGTPGAPGLSPFPLIYLDEGHRLRGTGVIMLDLSGTGTSRKIIFCRRLFSVQV